jgi:hypothetical protein
VPPPQPPPPPSQQQQQQQQQRQQAGGQPTLQLPMQHQSWQSQLLQPQCWHPQQQPMPPQQQLPPPPPLQQLPQQQSLHVPQASMCSNPQATWAAKSIPGVAPMPTVPAATVQAAASANGVAYCGPSAAGTTTLPQQGSVDLTAVSTFLANRQQMAAMRAAAGPPQAAAAVAPQCAAAPAHAAPRAAAHAATLTDGAGREQQEEDQQQLQQQQTPTQPQCSMHGVDSVVSMDTTDGDQPDPQHTTLERASGNGSMQPEAGQRQRQQSAAARKRQRRQKQPQVAPQDHTPAWRSIVLQYLKEHADPEQLQATGSPATHCSQITVALQAEYNLAVMQPCCDGPAALHTGMLRLIRAEMQNRGLAVPGYDDDSSATDSDTASQADTADDSQPTAGDTGQQQPCTSRPRQSTVRPCKQHSCGAQQTTSAREDGVPGSRSSRSH